MVWRPSSQDLELSFKLDLVGEKDALADVSEKTGNNRTLGNSSETPVSFPKGIVEGPSQRLKRSTAQLKCLYPNAYSMDNNQDELKTTMQLANCNAIAVMEMVGQVT